MKPIYCWSNEKLPRKHVTLKYLKVPTSVYILQGIQTQTAVNTYIFQFLVQVTDVFLIG